MNNFRKFVSWFILILAALYLGYNIGKLVEKKNDHTDLTQNYSFVRTIAELASLEVTGITTLRSPHLWSKRVPLRIRSRIVKFYAKIFYEEARL